MKHKKFIAFAMSALMFAGNGAVFAAGNKSDTIIQALCKVPEIRVTVPETGTLFINPYKMSIGIDGETTGHQIVSTPGAILNESPIPISVSATVTGTIKEGSDMTLSGASIDPNYTKKKAFIYFEIQPANDPNAVTWDSEFDVEKHIIVRSSTKTKKNIVTLDAFDENGKKKCYGAFRLTGDCAAVPKIPWTESDGINVTVAFTFKPTDIS